MIKINENYLFVDKLTEDEVLFWSNYLTNKKISYLVHKVKDMYSIYTEKHICRDAQILSNSEKLKIDQNRAKEENFHEISPEVDISEVLR